MRTGLRMGPRRRFWFLRDELPGCLDYEVASPRSDDTWIAIFGVVVETKLVETFVVVAIPLIGAVLARRKVTPVKKAARR